MTAPSKAPLLAIRSLRAAYGKIEALKGVDIDINAGEIVALIGANGAGKSKLMMTIFGRPRARSGRIEFDGQDMSPLDTDAIARFLGEVGGVAQGIVITSVFAPVSPRHELLAAEIVKRELGEAHVSLSHEIGSIGLLLIGLVLCFKMHPEVPFEDPERPATGIAFSNVEVAN